MDKLPRSRLAIRYARMLLIKAGLNEREADAFLDRLTDELASGRIVTEEATRSHIERELAEIKEELRKTPGRIETIATGIATGLVAGLASAGIYDFVKPGLEGALSIGKPDSITRPSSGHGDDLIQIEWALTKLPRELLGGEATLRRALQIYEQRHGSLDMKNAVYLDAIGMLLDRRGKHSEARRFRRQALRISEHANGPVHESTGAIKSNIGLSYLAQRRYAESAKYLLAALDTQIKCLGIDQMATIAALYNCWVCLTIQDRVRIPMLPKEAEGWVKALPEMREAAKMMMLRKAALTCLLAVSEIAENLRLLARPNLVR
jgi:tetratricopeptide (TPR) repeat protein